MANSLTKENATKLKDDVVKWCDENDLLPARLCRALNYNSGYLANVFARTLDPSDRFMANLETKTGLKKEDYL